MKKIAQAFPHRGARNHTRISQAGSPSTLDYPLVLRLGHFHTQDSVSGSLPPTIALSRPLVSKMTHGLEFPVPGGSRPSSLKVALGPDWMTRSTLVGPPK